MLTFTVMVLGWAVLLSMLAREASFSAKDLAGAVLVASAWFGVCLNCLR